jgi:hypothetical protein
MSARNQAARILVAAGALALFTLAVFHLKDYAKDTLQASSLSTPLLAAFRAIFVLVGWQWIVVGIIALMAALTDTTLRRALVLVCGAAILVEAAVTLTFMGMFLGTELMGAAAVLMIGSGLLFRNTSHQ